MDGDGKRPLQPQARIVVHQAAFRFRRVEFSDLIARFRFVAQDLVSVGKALGHVNRPAVVFAEFDGNVLQVGRAFRTQVHDDIEDGTARGAYEFRLGGRRKLKMHASQRSFLLAESNIGLGDDGLQPMRRKFMLTERAGEKAPRIPAPLDIDHERALELRLGKDHVGFSL